MVADNILDPVADMLMAAVGAGVVAPVAIALVIGAAVFLTLPIRPMAKLLILAGVANEIRGLVVAGPFLLALLHR